ncbi:C3HC-type domain-containing protein [Heracleum sosnowskyi]|uniref:C3HC-type domain-containing protein n=1 Tax=Heracleum sosnowskyi TaxID=360622 RepID=A0AAD8JHF7_9APIA|nr:C3HC-type domain-containing protein [Heracleum sosnowskyi]
MAKEAENRLNVAMDKLFHAPNLPKNSPKSNSLLGVQGPRGRKRPSMAMAFSNLEFKSRGSVLEQSKSFGSSGGAVEATLCRPWDRGDLHKRLATFKSMTWFAKPEVVSAVNCARRGWVNVDSDIIACEACGSRHLFSTPSSWTQHQVEKAAKVFSLKLDNGHKIFCPWVDNVCDEALAQFPPMTATSLVDNYKNRCDALLQLSALPVISTSGIELMRSPQLDDFLKESTNIGFISKSANASSTADLRHEFQAVSSSYSQALKLVSLCGWESRLMPYFVEYEAREDLSIKDVNLSDPSNGVSTEESSSIKGTSEPNKDLAASNDPMAATYHPMTSSKQYDPNSIVLDCRLCGASVGLWAFSTSPRPREFIRLVGELDGEKNDAYHKRVNDTDNGNSVAPHNLDIVVSENSCETARDTSNIGTPSQNERPASLSLTIAGGPSPAKQNFQPTISLPFISRNLRDHFLSDFESRPGHGQCNDIINEPFPCLGSETSEQFNMLRSEKDCNMSLEELVTNDLIIPEIGKSESVMKYHSDNIPSITQSSNELLIPEDVTVIESGSGEDLCPARRRDSVESTTVEDTSFADDENVTSDTLTMNAYVQSKQGHSQGNHGKDNRTQAPESDRSISKVSQMKKSPVLKRMDFDPIRQHRHFCPWITSSGSSPPGWKQTLSALQHQKELSSPSLARSLFSSLIEVDAPVASIKKLFMSPSPKRSKAFHVALT